MLNLFHSLGIVGCKAVNNKNSMIKYLAHRSATSTHKEQFTDDEIEEQLKCSNPDKRIEYIRLITGKDPIISNYDKMFSIITSDVLHFNYYVDLLSWLRQNDIELYVFACRNSNFCLKVLRSQEYKNKKKEEF